MKIILTTLNSKFIHTSLSIRYLKSYCQNIPMEIMEFTINQNLDYIVGELYKKRPNIVGFSTYIWNREETFRICESLKIIDPNILIVLGGPEVSFDGDEILENFPFIDFIIYGEGEVSFKQFLETILNDERDFHNINGLIYRNGEKVIVNPPRELLQDLDSIPSPYKNLEDDFENKIVYYESSRGCPFNCQFCLSSTIKGVRYFNIQRVKEDLEILINGNVGQVKFVDRTFNANKKFAMEIMEFIMEKDPKNMNFHFEVTAHLLDREMLDFIKKAKEGLFQFEIGVQSTNSKTLEAIGRTTDLDKLKQITKEIKSNKNIHQHLDLIAGLPYEDYNSFKNSFNEVYEIKPEKIQLGFLKLLKGSGLRKNSNKYGIKFLDKPPYEVLKTNWIRYAEILKLKGIEDLVEKYYNEGYFTHSLEYIIKNHYKSPFDFFEDFLIYWESKDYHTISHSRNRLYEILLSFCHYKEYEELWIINEILKYDYIYNHKNPYIPKFIDRKGDGFIQKNKHEILKDENILNNYLSQYKDMATKELIKRIHIEEFKLNLFELFNKDYIFKENMLKNTFILFEFKDGVINKCMTYNITNHIKRSG